MGSKKRSFEYTDDKMEEVPTSKESHSLDSHKKLKKGNQKEAEGSVKPMERKKNRRAVDKERHRTSTNIEEVKPKQQEVAVSNSRLISGNGLPQFHIDVFKDLASVDVPVRLAAVEKIVTELRSVQEAFEKVQDKGSVNAGLGLEATKDDGLDDCAPSVRYAVRRLIRGASSSREFARQGFSLGLSLLVASIPTLRLDSMLRLIVNLLEVSSSMKGQEARDCLLGRLFCYGAISRSGRLMTEWNSDQSTPFIKELVSALVGLASKKRYLQEPAVAIIADMVEQLPVDAITQHLLKAPGLDEWFQSAIDAGNPDALFLALSIQEKIHSVDMNFGKVLPVPYSASSLFSSNHLTILSNCLKESTFCQPRSHSVWPILVNLLLPETIAQSEETYSSNSVKKRKKGRKISSSEEEIAKNLKNFCEVIIEGSLLMSSHDRKHLALDVVLLLLQKLPSSMVSIVFSYKLVHCLMDILSTKESWLYKIAQYFLKALSEWVENDDVRKVAVIVALQRHSNARFDLITKSKTVKTFVESFKTESGCMLFIQNLVNIFVDDGNSSDEPSDQSQTTDDNSDIGSVEDKDLTGTPGSPDLLRLWIVEAIPGVLKHLTLDQEAKARVQKEILKLLSVQGIFSASLGTEVTSFELQETFTWPKASASNAVCKMCIEQIQSLLASIQKAEGLALPANNSEPYDICSYFISFLTTLHSIPSVSLFCSLSNEDELAFEKLLETGAKLSGEERNHDIDVDINKLHAVRYLLIQVLLQVLHRPGEFADAASELIIICKKAFAAYFLDQSDEETGSDTSPELMDVLVDTLLSLLPQSTAAMRSAIEQVFKYFCEDITDDGLGRMLKIIKKDLKPARHQAAESENEEEEDNDDDIFGIEEELDDPETNETAESDEQTDFSETLDEIEVDHTKQSDSDGELDDDAMFRMDTYLAQIFKDKKNQAGGESAQSQLVLFKLRVLSLVEIYLHENSGKSQVLRVYSNLAQTLVNPHTAEIGEQLAQRIWGILQKKVFKAKDFPKGESLQMATLETLLEKNLKLASKPVKKKFAASTSKKKVSALKERQKMISSLARESTFWILKIIDASNFSETDQQKVIKVFDRLLVMNFSSKKLQLKSDFLKEVFRRRPWIGHHLFDSLFDKIASAKSDFCRVEGLDLMLEILKSLSMSTSDRITSKISKHHVKKLASLVKELVTHMPEKQSRRAEVRKFCNKVIQILSSHDLIKLLLKDMEPETQAACQSQLGETFVNLMKSEKN